MALGLALGGLGGAILTLIQQPVYQATASLMFTQQTADGLSGSSSGISDKNVAATLSQLVISNPVLSEAGKQLDFHISDKRVKAAQVLTSRVISVSAADSQPDRAALIANTIVTVFIQQQAALRAGLFASEEQSLKAQIDQVQGQIDALQKRTVSDAAALKDQQITGLEKEISSLQKEIGSLQQEIVLLQVGGTPVPGYDASSRRVMVPPTRTVDQEIDLANKTNRLADAQRLLDLYQNIYIQLTYGKNAGGTSPGTADSTTLTLTQYQNIYATLLDNYEAIRLARMQSTPDLLIVENAFPPEKPIRPDPLVNQLIGALLGLALGAGLAFFLVTSDEVIRTAEEARILLRLPVLGSFPRGWGRQALPLITHPRPEELVVESLPASGEKNTPVLPATLPQIPVTSLHVALPTRDKSNEGLRFLYSNLDHIFARQDVHMLMISSPQDSLVGAQLSLRLSMLAAQMNRPTLLVDANFRDPQVQKWLGMEGWTGLEDVLEGKAELNSVIRKWDGTCLSVICTGRHSADPSILLNQPSLDRVFADLRQRGELVIIIGPSFAFAESVTLASVADGVLLAIELDETRATAALATMEQLSLIKAPVVGMALA
jgi:capsular polysaccharide biosynthesis protein/Mrp family chromosome partitioning ATPase